MKCVITLLIKISPSFGKCGMRNSKRMLIMLTSMVTQIIVGIANEFAKHFNDVYYFSGEDHDAVNNSVCHR